MTGVRSWISRINSLASLVSRKGVNHERPIREKSQGCRRRRMVGYPDRRWLPHPSMAHLPRRDVRSPGVAALHVGAGRRLAFRPERVVLGHGGVQVLRLAHDFGGPLVDAVVEPVAQ